MGMRGGWKLCSGVGSRLSETDGWMEEGGRAELDTPPCHDETVSRMGHPADGVIGIRPRAGAKGAGRVRVVGAA